MVVHRPVWNADSLAMWEWEGGGFSGLCVACGLRARTPLLESWPASPSDSPLPCFVSSSVTISFIQVRAGSWLWTPVLRVCLPGPHSHECTLRQMPFCCVRTGFSLIQPKSDCKLSSVFLFFFSPPSHTGVDGDDIHRLIKMISLLLFCKDLKHCSPAM